MPTHRCEPSDYDAFAPPSDNALYTLNKYKSDPNRNLYCLDWDELSDDLEIFGNWRDPSMYQRIEFMLTPCNYVHTLNDYEGDTVTEQCNTNLTAQEEYLGNMLIVIYSSDQYFN